MLLKLFLCFTIIPLVEVSILMHLGAMFGVGLTLFIVVGTGFLGAYLAKREGYRVLFQIQQEMQAGRLPANELIDALLIFVSGVVLITPGLLTDCAGFILLFPFTRSRMKEWIVRKIQSRIDRQHTTIYYNGS